MVSGWDRGIAKLTSAVDAAVGAQAGLEHGEIIRAVANRQLTKASGSTGRVAMARWLLVVVVMEGSDEVTTCRNSMRLVERHDAAVTCCRMCL